MNMYWVRTSLALMLLTFGSGAAGQSTERPIFECLHPDGRVEFRSTPLVSARCTIIERRTARIGESASVSDDGPAAAPIAESGATTARDPRARTCENARKNRDLLESDTPVITTGPDGQQLVLSPEERAAALRTALRDIEYWCEPR